MSIYNIDFNKDMIRELDLQALKDIYEEKITINKFNNKYGTKLKNFISLVIYTNNVCDNCGEFLKIKMVAKSDIRNINKLKLYCDCGHTGYSNCSCDKCYRKKVKEKNIEDLKYQEYKKKKLILFSELENLKEEVSFENVDYKFYIGVLYIYEYFGIDEFYINHPNMIKMFFDNKFLLQFIKKMVDDNLLKIVIKEEHFDNYDVEEEIIKCNETKIIYKLNISKETIFKISDKVKNDLDYENIVKKTFKLIAMGYLSVYFVDRLKAQKLNEIVLDTEYINSMKSFLLELLDHYSVSYLLKGLYYAVNKASNFKIEYNVDYLKVEKAIKTNLKNGFKIYSKDEGFDEVIYFEQCVILEFISKEIIKSNDYWFITDFKNLFDKFHIEEKKFIKENEEKAKRQLELEFQRDLEKQKQLNEIKSFMKNIQNKFDEMYYSYINFKENKIPDDFIKNHFNLEDDAISFLNEVIKEGIDILSIEDKLAFLKEFNLA